MDSKLKFYHEHKIQNSDPGWSVWFLKLFTFHLNINQLGNITYFIKCMYVFIYIPADGHMMVVWIHNVLIYCDISWQNSGKKKDKLLHIRTSVVVCQRSLGFYFNASWFLCRMFVFPEAKMARQILFSLCHFLSGISTSFFLQSLIPAWLIKYSCRTENSIRCFRTELKLISGWQVSRCINVLYSPNCTFKYTCVHRGLLF